jgi:hypothetical protein
MTTDDRPSIHDGTITLERQEIVNCCRWRNCSSGLRIVPDVTPDNGRGLAQAHTGKGEMNA